MRWIAALFFAVVTTGTAYPKEDLYSGNTWLVICKSDSLMCLGYVVALLDTGALYDVGKGLWCVPRGVTPGQVQKVLARYLETHPATLHERFIYLAGLALIEAYPCPPDTASVKAPRQ